MKYYAVIDTNVLVSAVLKEGSAPWQVVKEALDGCITPLLNGDILSEYSEVLLRKKICILARNRCKAHHRTSKTRDLSQRSADRRSSA